MSQASFNRGRSGKALSEGVYMYTMPDMPRPKQKGPTDNFQFRMTAEEFEIWESLWKKAKARNAFVNKSKFNRVLIGLIDDEKLISREDRNRFYMVGRGTPEIMGVAPPGRARIRQIPEAQQKKAKGQ